MKGLISKGFQSVLTHWLVIFYAVLFSMNALASAIVASFMNTEWANLSDTSRFLLIIVIMQNWTGTMIAFFNKTISRLEQGKPILETGNTQMFTQEPKKP